MIRYKTIIVFILLFIVISFTGCSNQSPQDTAKDSVGAGQSFQFKSGKELDEFSKYLPEDTRAYLSIENVIDFVDKLKNSQFYREIAQNPDFAKVMEELFMGIMPDFFAESDVSLQSHLDLFAGQAAFALLGPVMNTEFPDVVWMVDIGNNFQHWKNYIENNPKLFSRRYEKNVERFVYRFHENIIIFSINDQLIDRMIMLQNNNSANLFNNHKYREFRKNIPADSVLTAYASNRFFYEKNMGILEIKETDMYSGNDADLYPTMYSSANMDAEGSFGYTEIIYENEIFFSKTGKSNFLSSLKFCPQDSAMLFSANVDFNAVLDEYRDILVGIDMDLDSLMEEMNNEFDFNLEDDFIKTLGSELFVNFGQLNDFSSISNLLVGLEVNNENRLGNAIKKLIEDYYGSVSDSDYKGNKMFSVSIQGLPFAVHYTFHDGFLIAGGNQISLQSAVDRTSSGDNLSDYEPFRNTVAMLDKNSHFLLFYQPKYIISGLPVFMNGFSPGSDFESPDSLLMQFFQKLYQESTAATVTWENNTVTIKSFNSIGLPINLYSAAPFMAAVFVSNFTTAQVRAKVARTRADLRSLSIALECHYVDYVKLPDNLCALTTPIDYVSEVFDDPFADGQKIKFIKINEEDWMLYGIGPDKIDNNGEIVYDPTNGTKSRGDILRSRKNGWQR